ncbi:MAG TPA: hypothetical protein PLK40_07445 [Bacteroidaceae bacterium]|nr:hypothetical protein [Bacteroidaceae bacterium]
MSQQKDKTKSFESKVNALIMAYEQQRDVLQAQQQKIQTLEKELQETRTQYALLKDAKYVEVKSMELTDTKTRLAHLVNDVDQCIAILTKDDFSGE